MLLKDPRRRAARAGPSCRPPFPVGFCGIVPGGARYGHLAILAGLARAESGPALRMWWSRAARTRQPAAAPRQRAPTTPRPPESRARAQNHRRPPCACLPGRGSPLRGAARREGGRALCWASEGVLRAAHAPERGAWQPRTLAAARAAAGLLASLTSPNTAAVGLRPAAGLLTHIRAGSDGL